MHMLLHSLPITHKAAANVGTQVFPVEVFVFHVSSADGTLKMDMAIHLSCSRVAPPGRP